jgi:enoyl-CoA hydratase/carnithine racemase
MRRLLSDARIRLGACVLAMAAAAGMGVVTQAKEPVTRAEGTDEPARTVVNRTALSCPALAGGGELSSVVNAVAPTLPEGTPTAAGNETPLSITPLPTTADPVGSLLVRGKIGSTTPVTKPAPLSIRAIRATMREGLAERFRKATVWESAEQGRLSVTRDFREGVRASAERRPPRFAGA